MQETIDCNWSTRTLERQIGNLYYERMLMSHNTQIVKDEAAEKEIRQEPKDIIKDPYVLEFLGLKDNTDFRENELEQAIIDKLQNFLQARASLLWGASTDLPPTRANTFMRTWYFITIYSNSF